uniref:Uncharacterized protein n=1 Tax=Anabas testudineus TaxID=64144 RepID=A0A3Q1K7D1_ANATE
VVPIAIINLLINGLGLCGSRAHIQQQVEMSIQHLNSKEIHLESLGTLGVLRLLLRLAVAEEKKAIGLCGAEVKGDGAGLLGIPFVEDDIRLGRFKCNWVQSGHILTLKGHSAMDFHFGITLSGQSGQLKSHIVVFVHNLN